MRHWMNQYTNLTGIPLRTNMTIKSIVMLHYGPKAGVAFEIVQSLGLDPMDQEFWDFFESSLGEPIAILESSDELNSLFI